MPEAGRSAGHGGRRRDGRRLGAGRVSANPLASGEAHLYLDRRALVVRHQRVGARHAPEMSVSLLSVATRIHWKLVRKGSGNPSTSDVTHRRRQRLPDLRRAGDRRRARRGGVDQEQLTGTVSFAVAQAWLVKSVHPRVEWRRSAWRRPFRSPARSRRLRGRRIPNDKPVPRYTSRFTVIVAPPWVNVRGATLPKTRSEAKVITINGAAGYVDRQGAAPEFAGVQSVAAWALGSAATVMSKVSLTDPPLPSLAVTFTATVPRPRPAACPRRCACRRRRPATWAAPCRRLSSPCSSACRRCPRR